MKKLLLCVVSFALLSAAVFGQAAPAAPAGQAHDITGNWQGTLHAGNNNLRLVLKISKALNGTLSAVAYSIDQGAQPMNASSVTLDGLTFKFSISLIGGSYEGKLSSDGNSIVGNWTQGTPLPLTWARATPQTAWEIPAPPPPPKAMAADADPSFEVATIKPNNSGKPNLQALVVRGRNFETVNSSLGDLISFAYEVQREQIVNGPPWLNSDRYDISAIPDQPGMPNPAQIRSMIKKLLTSRFKLTFHEEKRDLSAYVLTIAKNGNKLSPTEIKGNLPGLGMRPTADGLMILVRNATMKDYTGFLQTLVLDRPVVDQTGLTGKYDFQFTFTPNESQFHGHSPLPPATPAKPYSAPNLFEAMQQQLGLKMESRKTPVDVIAIDHVDHPSPN